MARSIYSICRSCSTTGSTIAINSVSLPGWHAYAKPVLERSEGLRYVLPGLTVGWHGQVLLAMGKGMSILPDSTSISADNKSV